MKAVEEDPYFSIAYYNMGAVYFNLRRYEEVMALKVKETSMDWRFVTIGESLCDYRRPLKSLQNYDALS